MANVNICGKVVTIGIGLDEKSHPNNSHVELACEDSAALVRIEGLPHHIVSALAARYGEMVCVQFVMGDRD